MRILHITSHLDVGGISTYVLELSEALAARGHQVAVASGGGALAGRLGADGMADWRVPLRTSAEVSPQVAWACWRLSRRLAAHPVDVIHAHTRVAQVAAHWLSRRHRIPYVTTWHGFYRRRRSRRWWPCTGARTIAISEPVREHLVREFGVPADHVRLIPHGIPVARFERPVDPDEQRRLRERLRLSADGPVVGTMSRLVPSKGVSQLIEGFHEVRAAAPRAQLLIIGDGPDRPRLEQLAAQRGLAEAVRFAGTVPETRAALSLLDVFVFLPAVQEGFGLSLLEAMASARPIVAVRRGGGSTWVLERSQVGVLVEPDDPRGLGQAVARLLAQPEEARRLGLHARDVAKREYDFTRVVNEVERVYKEVVLTCRIRDVS